MDENNEVKEVETVVNDTPSETPESTPSVVDNGESNKAEQTAVETVNTDKKPNLNTISDIDKATYSFHKQLSKQKAKYEKMMEDMRKSYEDRFDRLEHPEKYRQKTRDDFDDDNKFVDYKINTGVEEKWNSLINQYKEQYEKQQQEEAERMEMETEYRNNIDANVSRLFPDVNARNEYQSTVDKALKAGLGQRIDGNPRAAQYIIQSPNGPKIMYELAKDKDLADNIFGEFNNEYTTMMKLINLEQKAMSNPVQPTVQPEVPPQTTNVKPLGKPGKGLNPNSGIDALMKDNRAILDLINRAR